jgi:hypothetical protein
LRPEKHKQLDQSSFGLTREEILNERFVSENATSSLQEDAAHPTKAFYFALGILVEKRLFN